MALFSLLVQGCIYCFKLHIHVHLICLFCCFRLDWQKPDCVSFDCISMDPLLWFWNKNDIYCYVTIFITDPKLALLNNNFSSIVNDEKMLILSILNPESEMIPAEARLYCDTAFRISRSFCYDLYKKREKFYEIKWKYTCNLLQIITMLFQFCCNWPEGRFITVLN